MTMRIEMSTLDLEYVNPDSYDFLGYEWHQKIFLFELLKRGKSHEVVLEGSKVSSVLVNELVYFDLNGCS